MDLETRPETEKSCLSEKRCIKCAAVKPLGDFVKHKQCVGGFANECRVCRCARNKRAANPASAQRAWLKYRYGMTPEQYDAMLGAQGFVCAICLETDPTGRRLAVDHNHATGVIRGLLCHPCNVSLGAFKEDTKRMKRAVYYLQHHSTH